MTVDDLIKQAENKIDQLLSCSSLSACNTATHNKDMGISAAEIADFIEQFVNQQSQQGAVGKLTGEKRYKSVESGSRYHFVIGLLIDSGSKTVQMEIAKGHHYQALAPLHQYVQWGLRGAVVLYSAMKVWMQSCFTQSWQQM